MPNCFTLIRKSNIEAGPVVLDEIDAELCSHFNEPFSDKSWFREWYISIGLGLACGHSFAKLKEVHKDTDLEEVIDYLDKHYTTDAWTEVCRK